jgi:hypothetical protein
MNIKTITLFTILFSVQETLSTKEFVLSSFGKSKDKFIEELNSIPSDATNLKIGTCFLEFTDKKLTYICRKLQTLDKLESLDLNEVILINLSSSNIETLFKIITELPSLKTVETSGSTFTNKDHQIHKCPKTNTKLLENSKSIVNKMTAAGFRSSKKKEVWTR